MLMSEDPVHDKHLLGVQIAGIGLGTVDYVGDTITLDDRAASLFDLAANVPVSRATLHAKIHAEDWPKIKLEVDRLLDPEDQPFIEVVHRIIHDNGDVIWVSARKQIQFTHALDGSGAVPVSGLVALIDVTEHKESQQKVQFLLDELNHRSKNMLTVVQSIARRTFATGDVDTFTDRFSDRLAGLAHNYDAMVRGAWQHADLEVLVSSHLGGFVSDHTDRVVVAGPSIKISPKEAEAVGLALHELATNATKYGALSVDTGVVAINWFIDDEDLLTITWTETGGPSVVPPTRKGFGNKVTQDMAEASLRGKVNVDYRPEGLIWQLRYPSKALG